ncbi:MAG: hypothetical protein CME64_07675 [Halobacteriovoraceae bacterium]|nr:hypothetical protein [Halobacteriovoraceae bacterium]|tara:strand:+ start:81206 stop:82468 length:1263 start_codon:yes stop_codon:yes gene_type:complete
MKFLIISLFFSMAHGIELENLTGDAQQEARASYISRQDPGIRIAVLGIKESNSEYGPGEVNSMISDYEKSMTKALEAMDAKVVKTDFKGYYLTCNPSPKCLEKAMQKLNSISPPHQERDVKLGTSQVISNNYREGYMNARIHSHFPDQKEDMHKFISKKLKSSLVKATGQQTPSKDLLQSGDFTKTLGDEIDKFRANGPKAVSPRFRDLVLMLDLLEIPYSASSDIDKELSSALNAKGQKKSLHTVSAQTGDDLFVVIKKGDENLRLVGADARGLGRVNMLTRFQEFASHMLDGDDIDSMDEVFKLSESAIKIADAMMETSMKKYEEILNKELRFARPENLDEALEKAHAKYNLAQSDDINLMQIRAGALDKCNKNQAQLMNRIGALHKRLKMLEGAGIENAYGSSCLGLELQLLRKGLK